MAFLYLYNISRTPRGHVTLIHTRTHIRNHRASFGQARSGSSVRLHSAHICCLTEYAFSCDTLFEMRFFFTKIVSVCSRARARVSCKNTRACMHAHKGGGGGKVFGIVCTSRSPVCVRVCDGRGVCDRRYGGVQVRASIASSVRGRNEPFSARPRSVGSTGIAGIRYTKGHAIPVLPCPVLQLNRVKCPDKFGSIQPLGIVVLLYRNGPNKLL